MALDEGQERVPHRLLVRREAVGRQSVEEGLPLLLLQQRGRLPLRVLRRLLLLGQGRGGGGNRPVPRSRVPGRRRRPLALPASAATMDDDLAVLGEADDKLTADALLYPLPHRHAAALRHEAPPGLLDGLVLAKVGEHGRRVGIPPSLHLGGRPAVDEVQDCLPKLQLHGEEAVRREAPEEGRLPLLQVVVVSRRGERTHGRACVRRHSAVGRGRRRRQPLDPLRDQRPGLRRQVHDVLALGVHSELDLGAYAPLDPVPEAHLGREEVGPGNLDAAVAAGERQRRQLLGLPVGQEVEDGLAQLRLRWAELVRRQGREELLLLLDLL
mmetsp:Transcript_67387/g.197878  ORF Transcript_67387/g.197878 Transcript_67387/m.197878 type:complete len:326 (+) Transcript_67387:531-1508(+)